MSAVKTEKTDPELRRLATELRKNYAVYPDHAEHYYGTSMVAALGMHYENLGEALLLYRMPPIFECDGILYQFTYGENFVGSMISVRVDSADAWDGAHFYYHDCELCDKPFELNEELYLRHGAIECRCLQ